MLYFVDSIKNIVRKNHWGVIIYLILNILFVIAIFSSGFQSVSGILIGLAAYIVSFVLALSPIGEWVIRYQNGCKKITRKEYSDRLEPLFREVLEKARSLGTVLPENIQLYMSSDAWANAFAMGRRTVCFNKRVCR